MSLSLESKSIYIEVDEKGMFTIYDKVVDIEWTMGDEYSFGILELEDGREVEISHFELSSLPNSITLTHINPEEDIKIQARIRLISPGDRFDLIINGNKNAKSKVLKFLNGAFSVYKEMGGFYVIPSGSGEVFIPSENLFSKSFSSQDLSMLMFGIINDSSLLLSIWDDPSLSLLLSSKEGYLSSAFITPKLPQRVQFKLIPEGEIQSIALSYREYVKRKNYIIPWEEKLKNRENVKKILNTGIILLRNREDDETLNFVKHIKNDLKLSRISFLAYSKCKDIEELGYGIISDDCGVSLLKIENPLKPEKDFQKERMLIGTEYLNESFLPDIDIYLKDKCNLPDNSCFPLFEMTYGDTVGIVKRIESSRDLDRDFLTAILLGRVLFLGEEIIPEGSYWEMEDEEGFYNKIEEYLSRIGELPIFMKGEGGWGEGVHPMDILLKNIEEILSPFQELVLPKKLTRFENLDGKAQVFYAEFDDDVEVVVNYSSEFYEYFSTLYGRTFLPPYGYIISSDSFLSFHACGINDYRVDMPMLVSVRTLDGKSFKSTAKIKIYHAFGPSQFKFMRKIISVEGEKIYTIKA